jgi:hypothetical protein
MFTDQHLSGCCCGSCLAIRDARAANHRFEDRPVWDQPSVPEHLPTLMALD